MPAALTGTLAGNRVASRVSASRLTAAFTLLLVAVAAYTLARSLHPGGESAVTVSSAAPLTTEAVAAALDEAGDYHLAR